MLWLKLEVKKEGWIKVGTPASAEPFSVSGSLNLGIHLYVQPHVNSNSTACKYLDLATASPASIHKKHVR